MQENKDDEIRENQIAQQFKYYIINMILCSIFFSVILYVIIDLITDMQKARLIKFNLRYKLK